MRPTLIPSAIALAALIGSPLHAQTIGTDPAADHTLVRLPDFDESSFFSQTFYAPEASGPLSFESLSIWYDGGSLGPGPVPDASASPWDQATRFVVGRVGPYDGQSGESPFVFWQDHSFYLDQAHSGRYDIFFNALNVEPGERLFFGFLTSVCDGPCGEIGPPQTGEYSRFGFEFSMSDTYPKGSRGDWYPNEGGSDIRFEATFVGVPEPGTLLLMVTGLLGIAVVGVRRKRARG